MPEKATVARAVSISKDMTIWDIEHDLQGLLGLDASTISGFLKVKF
jgi:hypothetical protein